MPRCHSPSGLVLCITALLTACGGGGSNSPASAGGAEPAPVDPITDTDATGSPATVPALGAAAPVEQSTFDALEQRAISEHEGRLQSATIDTELAGLTLSVLLDGPLMPEPSAAEVTPSAQARGLAALTSLPPFKTDNLRATWPELYSADEALVSCDQGSVTTSLVEDLPAQSRPYLLIAFADCQTGDLLVDGNLLIERPANALQRPTRIGFDGLQIVSSGTHKRLTGTFVWAGGDECGVGERRTATLLSADVNDGGSVLLDELTSYATAPSVLQLCGDALQPNGWRGQISFGALGVVTVETPDVLTHDWDSLPRDSGDEVIFGANVEPGGQLRLRGDLSTTDVGEASLTLENAQSDYPDSDEVIAVHLRIFNEDDVITQVVMSPLDTGLGALSRLGDDDQDGMPNGWEQVHALDPQDAGDASTDDDLDGVSNLAEFLALRDPHHAEDS